MTDLDRYGLFALAVVILLILFISMGDMECEEDVEEPSTASLFKEVQMPAAAVEVPAEPVARRPEPAAERSDFDFGEDPVEVRGASPSRSPERAETARDLYVMHRVRRGESFSSIAKLYYGSTVHWRLVSEANGGMAPSELRAGQQIRVLKNPADLTSGDAPSSPVSGKKTAVPASHVVQKNETLAGISKRYYGTARHWRKIYDANRSRIADPDVLMVGTRLQIPR